MSRVVYFNSGDSDLSVGPDRGNGIQIQVAVNSIYTSESTGHHPQRQQWGCLSEVKENSKPTTGNNLKSIGFGAKTDMCWQLTVDMLGIPSNTK